MVAAVSLMSSHRRDSSPVPAGRSAGGEVAPLRISRSDAALAQGLREGEPWARVALYDRYAPEALRILRRLVGFDADVDERDLLQEVFVRALAAADRLDDAQAISGWMRTITVRVAYRAIRYKRTRRWLRFWEPAKVCLAPVDDVSPELREVFERTARLLDRLPADQRLPLVLQLVEQMRLSDIADVCGVSLATVKRRIARAKARFRREARRDPVLRDWLEEEES